MLQSVVLPNGTNWTFTYTTDGYANLAQVTYPTGASISYGYSGTAERFCTSNPASWYGNRVTSRTLNLNDGSASVNWQYSLAYSNSSILTTLTDPLLNQTAYTFTGLGGSCAYNETQALYYQGSTASGTLLKTVITDYRYVVGVDWGDGIPSADYVFPIRKTVIWPNGQTTKSETDFDSSFTFTAPDPTKHTVYQGGFGRSIVVRDFDYASNAPGALLRTTQTSYQFQSYPNYLTSNLLSLTCLSTVYGPGSVPAQTSCTPPAVQANQAAQTAYGYDENNGSPQGTFGNLTSVSRWLNTANSYLATQKIFNSQGMMTQSKDPLQNTTQYTYDSTGAFIRNIQYPAVGGVSQSEQFAHDVNTGLAASHTDQNGQLTSYAYDNMWRPTSTTYPPTGGLISYSYVGSLPNPTVTTTRQINTSTNTSLVTIQKLDGLGRTIQSQLSSDPDGPTYTNTTYDPLGRVSQSYNPTRCNPPTTQCSTSPLGYPENTWGYTSNFYDALGRTCLVVPPDGTLPTGNNCPATQPSNTILTTYSGNCTTVTDQAGKSRKSCTDGLGHLTTVFEDPAGLNYETDYTYDALGNLLTVNQKGGSTSSANWRTRTYIYDSLARLTSATNPESGTATYSYDANDNLLSKTSPAPNVWTGTSVVTLSYCYDALNRVTGKAYSAQICNSGLLPSPLVSYFYDQTSYNGLTITNGVGRRTGMSDQAGSEAWSYDSMGRIVTDQRTTAGITKSIPYTYNLDGSLASIIYRPDTYPLTITYTPGGAGRPISAGNSSFGLASNVHYAPNGSLCSMHSSWGLEFVHNYTFNNRFQPTAIHAMYVYDVPIPSPCTTPSAPTIRDDLNLAYSYIDSNGHNNGNVASIGNNLDTHRTQQFSYDSLNRLFTANTLTTNQPWFQGDTGALANCWSEQYSYDPWGNLTVIAPFSSSSYTGCTQESGFNFANGGINTNNQIAVSGYRYDLAGNLIASPPTGNNYVYDVENHLISAGGSSYVYDGDGKRVGKAPGLPTHPNYLYWYGAGSNILEETDALGNYQYLDYYFDGKLLARSEPDNWVDHFFADALGNVRCVYGDGDPDGGCSDYYPFGGERPIASCCPTTSGGVNVPFKFTGKERDPETGFDNFGARFDSSSLGRFLSPDPDGSGTNDNIPQSWNAYSYVGNNPVLYTDPDGKTYLICASDAHDGSSFQCTIVSDAQFSELQKDPGAGLSLRRGTVYARGQAVGDYVQLDVDLPQDVANALHQAGNLAQTGLNYSLVLTAPNFLAIGGAHALLFGSSLTTLGGAACAITCPLVPVLGNKLDFLFGLAQNIGPNGAYNVQRSVSMLQDMERAGLSDSPATREYVVEKLTEALNNPAAQQAVQAGGRKVIDVLLMGPNGGVKLETIWEGTKLITLKTFR
jgi:RHS repeat-associated protein